MPNLSGLELILAIREYDPSIRILIISSYSDFTYAKKALEYGVLGYLVKPIDCDELTGYVVKVKNQLDDEFQEQLNSKENTWALKEKFLYDLARNALTGEEINHKSKALNLIMPENSIGIALLEIENFNDIIEKGLEDVRVLMIGTRSIIEDQFFKDFNGYVYQDDQAVYGLIFWGDKEELASKRILTKLQRLLNRIEERQNLKITIGYGGVAEGYSDMKAVWKKARLALERKVIAGDSAIISFEQVDRKTFNISHIKWESKNLLYAVECNNAKAIAAEVDALTGEFADKSISKELINALLYKMLFDLLKLIKDHNGDSSKVFGGRTEFNRLFESMRMKQVNEWLNAVCKEAGHYINSLKSCSSDAVISQIKNYIDSNYFEDLSLISIGRIFYLTPAYLGQLFKNTQGVSFNDYLNQLRIAEAKKIIQNGEIKVQDLIERVGYKNSEYFYKVFKKFEGYTYQEFRQLHSSK